MSTKHPSLPTPPDYQCYDCAGCGNCCRGIFAITATAEDYARIMAQGWGGHPALQGKTLFTPLGHHYLVGHDAEGACVFLNERGLCRIHAQFGEPAKPLGCRVYPFVFVPVGTEARVDLRMDCPAAAASEGRPLTAHRPDMLRLLPLVMPPEAAELPPPPLFGGVTLPWPRLLRITEALEGVLTTRRLDITHRLLSALYFAALLQTPRLAELDDAAFADFLRTVREKVLEKVGAEEIVRRQPGGSVGMSFRQLLGVYGREDRRGQRGLAGWRLRTSLALVFGRGAIPALRPGFPTPPFADIEFSFGIPSGEAAEALGRYYRMKLQSLAFCGRAFYGRGYLEGLQALLLTYPILLWFARVFAVDRQADQLETTDIHRAIALVDHRHGRSPLLDHPAERARQRFLTDRATLRELIGWYGS